MKSLVVIVLFSAFTFLGVSSCKKDFLNVNEDKHAITSPDVKNVLPNAQEYIAFVIGSYLHAPTGIWSQYWTQGPGGSHFGGIEKYMQTAGESDATWKVLYSGVLCDLNYVEEQSLKKNDLNYAAAALITKAFVFQILTDIYGDIPFSESLKGGKFRIPIFESQKDVYRGIDSMLLHAVSWIQAGNPNGPGAEDMFFKGNMAQWQAFANSLRLKGYLRKAYTEEAQVAKDSVTAMFGRNETLLQSDLKMNYPGSLYGSNPFNALIGVVGEKEFVAGSVIVDSMKSMADPRLGVFWTVAGTGPNTGSYNGLTQGSAPQLPHPLPPYTNYSLPSGYIGGSGNQVSGKESPVYLFTAAESNFLTAEAYARGWANGGTGLAEYEYAVELSFSQWGLSQLAANNYLADSRVAYPAGGTTEKKIQAIITQKWFAFCGSQNLEAWTELRRTGYPSFLTTAKSSVLPAGVFPARFVYPETEARYNINIPLYGHSVQDKVWWDQN